jgi:predicted dehydrogenase
MKPVGVGIVGCGKICWAYFGGAQAYDFLNVVACADIVPEVAQTAADEYGCEAVSVDDLLARDDIEIVINLTIPVAHAEIALRTLEAGKHTHCEKPLAVTLEDGHKIVEAGKASGLRVGCAPDTFMGSGIQTCRKLLDDGLIGRPIAGTAFMMCHGHESWHPNPGFFYLPGGGPVFDMGPYYITALINLLGPARRVSASTQKTFETRTCTAEARNGEVLPVEVTTHVAGTIDFDCGAIITMVMTFDVWNHKHTNIEVYGTEGSMQIPDPNGFGGVVSTAVAADGNEWVEQAHTHGYEGSRCIGVADMAMAIEHGRPHRCSGELALHALEIMHAFDTSSQSGRHVELQTTCDRPAALPSGLNEGELDAV